MPRFKRPYALMAFASIVAVAGVLSGCTSDDDASEAGAAAKAPTLELAVTSPDDGVRIRKHIVTVSGTVTRGSDVTINRRPADVRGRRFRRRVRLDVGRNRIVVRAEKAGFKDVREKIVVIRKRSPRPAPVTLPAPTPTPTPTPTPAPEPQQECDPNYELACLGPSSPDYDCEGGSGDGPDYTGLVRVVGDDPFELDRDGDGIACE